MQVVDIQSVITLLVEYLYLCLLPFLSLSHNHLLIIRCKCFPGYREKRKFRFKKLELRKSFDISKFIGQSNLMILGSNPFF